MSFNMQDDFYILTKGSGNRPEPPPVNNSHYGKSSHYETATRMIPPCTRSLFDDVPRIPAPDAIQWYQYRKSSDIHCTYPAEWCWDMEGQWLKFEQHYSINQKEAEANFSRFSLGANDDIIVDILNMKVTDKEIGAEYKLNRTNTLIGTLLDYGHIGFNGDLWNGTFLFDRNTGYDIGVSENDLNIGDKVRFNAFWNKDDHSRFIYDVRHKINASSSNLELRMLAFNIQSSHEECSEEKTESLVSVSITSDGYLPFDASALSYCDEPLIAPDFASQRFYGLILSFSPQDSVGLIVCFPKGEPLALLYHRRFIKDSDVSITVNSCVECNIGINPLTYGDGVFAFVAIDVVLSKYNPFDSDYSLIPITLPHVERENRGCVCVPSSETNGYGFVYNEFQHNMVTVQHDSSCDYREGMSVRYNERKYAIVDTQRCGYVAENVVAVERVHVDRNPNNNNNQQILYSDKHYIYDAMFKMSKELTDRVLFRRVTSCEYYTDIHLIVEESERYLNAYLNCPSKNRGCAIVFGVDESQRISGGESMSKAKREYIVSATSCRLKHFVPPVPSEYINIVFKQVIDAEGFFMLDRYVIIIDLAMVYDCARNITFRTSQNKVYQFSDNGELVSSTVSAHNNRMNAYESVSKLAPQFVFKVNENKYVNANCKSHNNKPHVQYVPQPHQQRYYQNSNSNSNMSNNNNNNMMNNHSNSNSNNNMYQRQSQPQYHPHQPRNSLSSHDSGHSSSSSDHNHSSEDTLQYTTPELNALPLPKNTEPGRIELSSRVQRKLNAMMKISEYMLDSRWQSILTMASSELYNAQKTTWQLMKNLETEKIRDRARKKYKGAQLAQINAAHAMFSAQKQYNHISNVGTVVSFHDVDGIIPIIPDDVMHYHDHESLPNGVIHSNGNTPHHMNHRMGVDHQPQMLPELTSLHAELDAHGLPILPDKSKYKAVALEYCQKMAWVKPTESIANDCTGYRATVSFGKPGKEKAANGTGLRQKNAIYEAYQQLVPQVIPIRVAKDLMMKWVPGYKKKETVMQAIIADTGQSVMKHPKSVLLEWAQKHGMAPPKTSFSEFSDSARNMRIWTARVTFGGKTIEAKASKKKDAESRCCQELLTFVMKRDIGSHEQ